MIDRAFFRAGHPPTLFAAFFYFDISFMVWVLLGPLGVQIASELHLDAGQKGLMVAVPILAGALLRVVNGVLVDRIGPKRTGIIGQTIVLTGLLIAWLLGIHSYPQVLLLGVVLGVAGSSFAVALPLASRWYPPEQQGTALGIAGAGNSGTVFAALFAPALAVAFGWNNVVGLAAIPVAIAFTVYLLLAKDSPNQPRPKSWVEYAEVLRIGDAWWFMFFYGVTFGGFSGLTSSLTIYFNSQYGLSAVTAGYLTAACVFAGSLVRPVGGILADAVGGVRSLTVMYIVAAGALTVVSFGLPQAWMALVVFIVGMLALGMGNGAVFQLVPQRFRQEIGVMTGLVGMTGGVGGFYLASSLGYAKQFTGSYQAGLLVFALLALVAVIGLTSIKRRWRTTWGAMPGVAPDLMAPYGPDGVSHGVATHCPYCALQCGMMLEQKDGSIQVVARDFPTNKGGLCRKGWTAATLLTAPDRLTSPLARARRGGPLLRVSWDHALDRIATAMRSVQAEHGRDAFAIFGGGGLTNEKSYALGKFARVALRTANIDYNGRFCMAAAAAAGNRAFGVDRGLPFPLSDIPKAEVILLAGANPAETMPPVMQYFDAQRAAGGKLIVSDPRRTPTAKAADLHLQLTPGTDAALANGLLHIAIQRGLIDRDYIETRTSGFEAVRRSAASYWPDRVERITGVPESLLMRAAIWLAEAASAMVLTARGTEQQSHGVDNVAAFINLTLALGRPGRPNSGYGCLTGQGNGQGGREHGQKADQLPGYRKLDNPAHRATVAAVWGIDPDTLPAPGLSAQELLAALGGPVRGLMVMASNIVVSAPDAGALVRRLPGLDFLAVADPFLSETAAMADVVLPTAQWAEEDGTMTNLEGRVLLRNRAVDPPPGVWTDLQVLKGLADRLGAGAHFSADNVTVFDELRRASAGGVADYAGVSYERIAAEDGVFWPCPRPEHPGTPHLFRSRFETEDGRARFYPVEYRGPAEVPDRDYPHFLTTGRLMGHYQSGTQTRRVQELAKAQPEPFVEMHPETARQVGIREGTQVRLTTRRGRMVLKAHFSLDIRMDTLFVPFHWGGNGAANLLTNTALDPIARIPEFKICAVRVEPEQSNKVEQP